MKRREILDYLNVLFQYRENTEKYATNGLQVEGNDEVQSIAFSVDASFGIIQKAVKENVDMLICHHGIFWPSLFSIEGQVKEKIQLFLENEISLVGMHLPLDRQPEIGNNICLANILEGENIREIASISYYGDWKMKKTIREIANILQEKLMGPIKLFDFSDGKAGSFVVCSGSGSSELRLLEQGDCEVFITGELRYEAIDEAKYKKISLISAGHYATETTGIQALQRKMSTELNLKTLFIEDRVDY